MTMHGLTNFKYFRYACWILPCLLHNVSTSSAASCGKWTRNFRYL